MKAIFYDLETSDRSPIGQILNYCFILVDQALRPISECTGKIHLSRLQLPSAGAILANRIPVLQHQQESNPSEREAMAQISKFLGEHAGRNQSPVPLIGFNSNRFDLTYLRTSLMRNGLNPYFRGGYENKDLLQAAQKLFVSNADFPKLVDQKNDGEAARYSLRLELLAQTFGLLKEAQAHESREDVLLTIKLAEIFRQRYSLDILSFQAYEMQPLHTTLRSGNVVYSVIPDQQASAQTSWQLVPLTLLDAKPRDALWIDLKAYQEGQGRNSIRWRSSQKHALFKTPVEFSVSAQEQEAWQNTARSALLEFESIRIHNFFEKNSLDIEAAISRIDFSALDILYAALWKRDRSALDQIESQDVRTIYDRHVLANYKWGNGRDEKVRSMLKEYALYRYGGAMEVPADFQKKERAEGKNFAPTYQQLHEELQQRKIGASEDDMKLLTELEAFYSQSDIYSVLDVNVENFSPRAA